jgi:hypothetical protein
MHRSSPVLCLAAAAAIALLGACPKTGPTSTPPPPPDEKPVEGEPPVAGADGAPCLRADECTSGVCEGEGCGDDAPGTCAPAARACTKDLRPYCGCDGVTFRTSGSCPGQRFSARAECPGDAAP